MHPEQLALHILYWMKKLEIMQEIGGERGLRLNALNPLCGLRNTQ
jgi:hypothetical protein